MTFDAAILLLLLLVVVGLLIHQHYRQRLLEKLFHSSQQQTETLISNKIAGLFHQFEAYLSLRDRLDLKQGLPYTPYWSAGPDFLKVITEHCLQHRPNTVVECSSGLTTLMLARCCQLNQQGHVYSLENGEQYAEASREHLQRYQLTTEATVIHAPLETKSANGKPFQWYAIDQLPKGSIDMLVIDGPPGFLQKHSRYPALPLLFDRLADHCTIFMDDADRDDEREIVELWLSEYPELTHEFIKTERGCSVLTLNRS
ncbi:MAG: class I SAM-dependent methyltransferase [Chromatiales bacterium]|nr:class I SAM-dependent methyltransferase [Chromatiales bacterium]